MRSKSGTSARTGATMNRGTASVWAWFLAYEAVALAGAFTLEPRARVLCATAAIAGIYSLVDRGFTE